MDYKDTISWLYNRLPFYQEQGKSAYKKDLDNVLRFFLKNGKDYLKFKTIHVGGTNGKGSVSHMLSSILQQKGLKVGLFTSPHLLDFRERVKVNGHTINKQFINLFVEAYKQDFIEMKMSFFEMSVALAFRYFFKKKVDIAIIEVGLGGRLDATNVIEPELSIITNVSRDHANILGNSLRLITKEKAGIIKNHTPIILGEPVKYQDIIVNQSQELNAKLTYAKQYFYDSDLRGAIQKKNINTCVTAISVLNDINYNISETHIIQGLKNIVLNTSFFGRWSILMHKPLTICDVAHNFAAFKILFNQLNSCKQKKHIILGFSKDKDINQMVTCLPNNAHYYICGSPNSRIMEPEKISPIFQALNLTHSIFNTSYNAYQNIVRNKVENDLIMITGSTFIVSDILKYLDKV